MSPQEQPPWGPAEGDSARGWTPAPGALMTHSGEPLHFLPQPVAVQESVLWIRSLLREGRVRCLWEGLGEGIVESFPRLGKSSTYWTKARDLT